MEGRGAWGRPPWPSPRLNAAAGGLLFPREPHPPGRTERQGAGGGDGALCERAHPDAVVLPEVRLAEEVQPHPLAPGSGLVLPDGGLWVGAAAAGGKGGCGDSRLGVWGGLQRPRMTSVGMPGNATGCAWGAQGRPSAVGVGTPPSAEAEPAPERAEQEARGVGRQVEGKSWKPEGPLQSRRGAVGGSRG